MFQVALLPRNLSACQADLNHDDPKVRLSVLKDVVRGGAEDERPARIGLLVSALSDASSEVRRQALLSLADFGAREALDDVLVLLRDVEIKVRQMAVLCLGEIAEPGDVEALGRLASLLRAGDPSLRYQALLAHSHLRPEGAAEDLLAGIDDDDAEVRELAIRLVDEILIAQERAIPEALKRKVLRAALDESIHVRLNAQLVAVERGWESPVDALLEVASGRLRVKEPRDEQQAIVLLGHRRERAAIRPLERRAFGRFLMSFDAFRYSALGALGRMEHERALKKLRSSLRARAFVDRTMAVSALGQAGDVESLPLLRALVGKPDRVDQETLAAVLKTLESVSALPG